MGNSIRASKPLAVTFIVAGLWFGFRGFYYLDASGVWGGLGLFMGIVLITAGFVVWWNSGLGEEEMGQENLADFEERMKL